MMGSRTTLGSNWRLRLGRAVALLCWLYLAGVVGVWLLLYLFSDRWWLATVIMFGPRWVWGTPLVVLVPAAVALRPRMLWVLAICLILVVGPLMGLCIPWRPLFNQRDVQSTVRVLSCNVHYKELDALALGHLIGEVQPDIVALQSWTSRHQSAFAELPDWDRRRDGELYLATRFRIRTVQELGEPFAGGKGAIRHYILEAPMGELNFFNLHLQTPRTGLSAVIRGWWKGADAIEAGSELRREQSLAATRWIAGAQGPILIAGDFNTPPDSAMFREYWSSYGNAFSTAGFGWGYTHFTRRTAVRIDQILYSRGWQCKRCWVGPNVGSEHRPVIADVEWIGLGE